jgi:uncharacterized phage protein gp47/JayE
MTGLVVPPAIDRRTAEALTRTLRALAPHYVREWPAKDEQDVGVGLIRIFAFVAEGVISRLNAAPTKNFIDFLEMLGVRLLPATPARAAVQFLPAAGTEATILVPPRTQVSASVDDTELPFETENNLVVVPGTLAALVAVDPAADAIFEPAPGFLELVTVARDEEPRTIVAFSGAGSNSFQLDVVDDITEQNILRISPSGGGSGRSGCELPSAAAAPAAAEYVIVERVEGQIVFVTEPLRREYAVGVKVQRLTRFTLFEGRNLQEHVLYLGHDELFNVKSAATFEILVNPRSGTPGAGPPLNVIWEFWGVPEGSKQETWHPLTLEADGSAGLTQGGRIVLTKAPGEIKPTEVNFIENRWIRAKLAEPILPASREQLPELDSVTFRTSSDDKGVLADAGLYNETPLDVNLEFRPFGFEPRTFDRFYLASADAFSKPGAEVEIKVELDVSDLLATPAATRYGARTLAFAHGAGGRLLRFESKPTEVSPAVPSDLGKPPGTRMVASTTPAASVNGARLGVFVRADDGFVWLARFSEEQQKDAEWVNLQAPADIQTLQFDPAVVSVGAFWLVFIVADDDVYWRTVDPANPSLPFKWTATNLPTPPASTPFAARSDDGTVTWVFLTDVTGVCHRLRAVDQPWEVVTPRDVDGAPRDAFLSAEGARPFARVFAAFETTPTATVFLRGKTDRVIALDVPANPTPADPVEGLDWERPETAAVDSNPWVLGGPGEWRVFVRGADDGLWEADLPGNWRLHTNLTGGRLRKDPIAIVHRARIGSIEQPFASVFSASDRNSLIEFRERLAAPDGGQLQAGPAELAFVPPGTGPKRPAPNDYIYLPESSGREARQIVRYDTDGEFAVLARGWAVLPEARDDFELLRNVSTGKVQDADDMHVTLEAGSKAKEEFYILVHLGDQDDIREIEKFDIKTQVATLVQPWGENPAPGDTYEVLESKRSGSIVRKADDRAVLSAGSSAQDDAFKDALIDFPNTSIPPARIKSYLGGSRMIIATAAFAGIPHADNDYEIVVSPHREKWDEYQEVAQTELRPQLSWEYWNGFSWTSLRVDDGTQNLLVPGGVQFRTPEDIAKVDVAGQENYWIRARIIGGDYGREIFEVDKNNQISIRKDPIRPPLIKTLAITYELIEDRPPERCLTFNNLAYVDQTAANNTPDKHFLPFAALPDAALTVYFGFDKPFRGGPARLLVAAKEMPVDESSRPRLTWEFRTETGWKTVIVDDQTNAYTRQELVTLVLPDALPRRFEFGRSLHWLRSRLSEGRWSASPELSGVFLNTVWAIQAETVRNEILGSSDAAAHQGFRFQRKPVLEGEEVRVRESTLTRDEREQVIRTDEAALLDIRDQQGVLETWVRWRPVDEFFEATAESRVYRLDRASGDIQFGDGRRGRIPPAGGDNIVAFAYQFGGGAAGNVAADSIATLVTAVAGVDSVTNPVEAGGGSEEATIDEMLRIGPAQISHRGRAVTPQDYESLAQEASREVRKTRCVPNRNAGGQAETGTVSVLIVPDSTDARPQPSIELRRSVQRHLESACEVTLAARNGIFVGPPDYIAVNVAVTVFTRTIDETAVAERKATEALAAFLHPLTGGVANEGWEFGEDLSASHLYTLLEEIQEIDHVEDIVLSTTRGAFRDRLEIGDNELLASGEHEIRMTVAN